LVDGVHLIPGFNLDEGVLCGTNVYAIGKGKKRILIDACKEDHKPFLDNVREFLL
jgi:hypothetical protein